MLSGNMGTDQQLADVSRCDGTQWVVGAGGGGGGGSDGDGANI